jgi:hypothetical protein
MSVFEVLFKNKYAGSLLGVGHDSGRENTLTLILFTSSIFLGLASLYTTFWGLNQYVHPIIALFIALGLNGLLFAVSWRIGVNLISGTLKPSLALIFFITLSTSVFFSYSSLLDTIYSKETRKRDELHRSKIKGEQLTSQLTQLVYEKSNFMNSANRIRLALDNWYNETVKAYSGVVADARKRSVRNIDNYNRLTERLNRLRSGKQTETTQSLINRTESSRNNIANSQLIPVETQLARIDPAKDEFDKAYSDLLQSNSSLTIENYNKMLSAYKRYVNELSQEVKDVPQEIYKQVEELDQTNQFFTWKEKNFDLTKKQDIEAIRYSLFDYIDKIPKSFTEKGESFDEIQKIRNQTDEIGKYGGDQVHPFVLSIGELYNWNYLAVGSLLIAVVLDGLVLLCGLVGAQPTSFLTMRRTEQLDEAIELGLSTLLSLNLQARGDTKNPFINRIITILKLCKPDLKAAQVEGMPAYISFEDIQVNNLQNEVGIFIAADLAVSNSREQKVWLYLRLILWLAEQIKRFDAGLETANLNEIRGEDI